MSRTHLTPVSHVPSLNLLLEQAEITLQYLESRLSDSLDVARVGDIMLQHIRYEGMDYPVWCLCIEDGTIRAYDTHEECIQTHAYRGLAGVELLQLPTKAQREEAEKERLQKLQELNDQVRRAREAKIMYRPQKHVEISSSSKIIDPSTSEPSFYDKIMEKMGKDFFKDWGRFKD